MWALRALSCQLVLIMVLAFDLCGGRSLHRQQVHKPASLTSCLQFSKYVPSPWERQWLVEAPSRQHRICGLLAKEIEFGRQWIAGVADESVAQLDRDVWSFHQYRNVCSATPQYIDIPIEPAVGLLRNPFALPCQLEASSLDVEDRSYLRLAPPVLTTSFPGRKLLMDLGAGKAYPSSLAWFVNGYQKQGMEFDEIWAWEVQETPPHEYWQTVPDDIVGKLHFYNTFASDKSGPPSPLAILKNTYSAGDFVVLKLDIDNEELESSIMQQVFAQPDMFGEVFFEKHFDAPEMRQYFGYGLSSTLEDTLELFERFRKAGLRLHYWP